MKRAAVYNKAARRPPKGCRIHLGDRWLIGLCVLASGCSNRPSRVHPPALDPPAAAAKALASFDANADGRLGDQELDACPGLKAGARAVDTNQDGSLSADEIAARIQQWSATRVALVAVNCTVVRNGQPLTGAAVKLVPEEFLGPNIKPAAGVSDRSGRVAIQVDGVPISGLATCGFYRVEISRVEAGQETVPAKFNRETTLGVEITEGDKRRVEGFVFDVSGR